MIKLYKTAVLKIIKIKLHFIKNGHAIKMRLNKFTCPEFSLFYKKIIFDPEKRK